MATVSIVTPSYNQAMFLDFTIQSVLNQEGNFFLDYLIVDGGSTDDSLPLIKKYEELVASGFYNGRCRGISYRWVSERDRGQSDALVKGFGMSNGDILAWLNSDDTYVPGTLQRVSQYFIDHPETGCLYGHGIYTTVDGSRVSEYPTRPFDSRLLAVTNFICQPAAFFTRAAYERCGGLDTRLRYSMDYDLWIRMARTIRFCYLPELLATYRLHDDSKTMAEGESADNHAETLETVVRHYGWAPINRVYGYCLSKVRRKFPILANPLASVVALCWSVGKYMSLNKVPRAEDLKLLNLRNLRLLLGGWSGTPPTDVRDERPK